MTRSFNLTALFVALCLTWAGGPREGEAQLAFPDIVGPELWIDGPEAVQPGNSRSWPDVAIDETGRRIHVWTAGGTGLDNNEVFVRRWDADGNPLEDPMMVNTTTVERQQQPRVAVSADGAFLVTYQSFEEVPPGVQRIMIRSRAFNANGVPVGTEQLLSTTPTLNPTDVYHDVAALRTPDGSGGGYVVVWKSNQASGSDTNNSIEGCLVSAAGDSGTQFQINSNTAGNQSYASVTEIQDGGFLATWEESGDVWGRRFGATGTPADDDFQISTFGQARANETDAAIGWDGRVLVVWTELGDDVGTSSEIWGRLFDADLVPLGPDFRINTVTEDTQSHPRIADYGPVGFLVVWGSDVSSGDDLGVSIEAGVVTGTNAFDHDGDGMDDPQVQYNIWDNDNNQQFPGAHGWYGRLAADWRSLTWDGDPPPDNTNSPFIISRDIEHCVFCDDFEWFQPAGPGSLWRWSSAAGANP